MRCPLCNAENQDGTAVCRNCGERLPVIRVRAEVPEPAAYEPAEGKASGARSRSKAASAGNANAKGGSTKAKRARGERREPRQRKGKVKINPVRLIAAILVLALIIMGCVLVVHKLKGEKDSAKNVVGSVYYMSNDVSGKVSIMDSTEEEAEVVRELKLYNQLVVIGDSDGHNVNVRYKRYKDGKFKYYDGWIDEDMISEIVSPESYKAREIDECYEIKSEFKEIYPHPTPDDMETKLFTLKNGNVIHVTAIAKNKVGNTYGYIEYKGKKGWINMDNAVKL